MAKFDPVGMAIGAVPLVVGGLALYEGYLVATNTEPYIKPDPLNDLAKQVYNELMTLINGDGGGGNCTTVCTAPAVLDTTTCTCSNPQNCTKVCTAPQILDANTCTCKSPPPEQCPAGQYRDAATNTCKTIPVTCAAGTHWDQGGNTCLPDAPVDCGTPQTNPGYTCCRCKVQVGRTLCPEGICCKECVTSCPSQCAGFSGVAQYYQPKYHTRYSRFFNRR